MSERCIKAVEGVREDCCIHEMPAAPGLGSPGQVCCWCGGIFDRRHDAGQHGVYAPVVAAWVTEAELAALREAK